MMRRIILCSWCQEGWRRCYVKENAQKWGCLLLKAEWLQVVQLPRSVLDVADSRIPVRLAGNVCSFLYSVAQSSRIADELPWLQVRVCCLTHSCSSCVAPPAILLPASNRALRALRSVKVLGSVSFVPTAHLQSSTS